MVIFLMVSGTVLFFCILYLVVYFAVHAGVQDALSADQAEEDAAKEEAAAAQATTQDAKKAEPAPAKQ